MVFYSATTPDFNLTWVAMQGSTREQILTKEEIRPICHELGSLSFGLAWRAGITNALQTHSMAWHVPVRSETFFPLRHARKFCKDLANQPVCMRIDEYARRYTATISGVIRKTNCGRRFTLLDLLVAGILQRGQNVWGFPEEKSQIPLESVPSAKMPR